MTTTSRSASAELSDRRPILFFVLAVLGFSFWFFAAVPFASHRETYWWLAMVYSRDFSDAFSFISSTYRPFHQGLTWLGFVALDPAIFPTSVPRQTVFQLVIYGFFVHAWWLLWRRAHQPRLLALVALVAGGIFFSGYIHLFHIYGLSYIPVMLMIGALLGAYAAGNFDRYELWLAVAAIVLVFWHPFTTALFVGFYFGRYLETFRQRNTAEHVRAVVILAVGTIACVTVVFGLPHILSQTSELLVETASRPLGTRLFAWLVSFQTNEVHWVASVAAFLLAGLTLASLGLSRTAAIIALAATAVLGAVFFFYGVPLLLLWIAAVLLKLLLMRCWSLLFLGLAATVLPLGGGIGTPIHALFAIIVAVFATALGFQGPESALSRVKAYYTGGAIAAAVLVVLLIRVGVELPVLSGLARPLLAERERTFQLEHALAWMRQSEYCNHDIAFAESADNPIDSVESAIDRQHRPPAALTDVQFLWETVLRCRSAGQSSGRVAVLTFGGAEVASANAVYEAPGRYAGVLTIWIPHSPAGT